MELTKEQIQYIDNRLEEDGIKHWDVRIEILDHVVSEIEAKLSFENSEYQFREMVQESFVTLGWKENFNGTSFEKSYNKTLSNIGRKYGKERKKEIYSFFNNPKILLLLFLGVTFYIFVSNLVSHKAFIIFSYALFVIPVLIYFYEFFRLWKKKIGKSFFKDQALMSIASSFFLFNVIMLMMKSEGQDFALPLMYQKPVLFVVMPIHFVLSYTGYKMYKKTIVEVEKMKKEMSL